LRIQRSKDQPESVDTLKRDLDEKYPA
jgi:hypothetical protein